MEKRKKRIVQIAKDINNIFIIGKEDLIINNNKINIEMDETLLINRIKSFGNINGNNIFGIPVLISLRDNKDYNINIKWKLNGNKLEGENDKLSVEWTETKSKDDNINIKQYDEKWQYNKQFNLNNNNNNNKMVQIKVDNKTAIYLVKIKYFNGNNWSSNSNIKSISIKEKAITQSFDKNNCGQYLVINGNTVTNNVGYWRSVFLLNTVQRGIHTWKF
eukprot:203212_1